MTALHSIRRVRHELVGRELTVAAIERLTPRMQRIHFESPELDGFTSLGADDHVALFFPASGEDDEIKRHYTPRSFEASARRLAIDFASHEAGPASEWAANARVGDTLSLGGPKSSLVVSDDFDWYLLIGDETALPALGRWVEGLRRGVPVLTVATVFDEGERQHFETPAAWRPTWSLRGNPSPEDGERTSALVRDLELPRGTGFVWIAGEASWVRSVRGAVLGRGQPASFVRAASYWKRGEPDVHEVLEG